MYLYIIIKEGTQARLWEWKVKFSPHETFLLSWTFSDITGLSVMSIWATSEIFTCLLKACWPYHYLNYKYSGPFNMSMRTLCKLHRWAKRGVGLFSLLALKSHNNSKHVPGNICVLRDIVSHWLLSRYSDTVSWMGRTQIYNFLYIHNSRDLFQYTQLLLSPLQLLL